MAAHTERIYNFSRSDLFRPIDPEDGLVKLIPQDSRTPAAPAGRRPNAGDDPSLLQPAGGGSERKELDDSCGLFQQERPGSSRVYLGKGILRGAQRGLNFSS